MLWQNAVEIVIACIACGFAGTHSLWAALVISPFMVVLAGLGHFYDVMDVTGWSMAIAPSACAFLGAGLGIWWRRTHPPEPDFVAPPPPPGWTPKARRRPRADKHYL